MSVKKKPQNGAFPPAACSDNLTVSMVKERTMRAAPAIWLTTTLLAGCASISADAPVTLPVSVPDLTSYALIRTNGGATPPEVLSVAQAARELARYDVIFIGESHRNPGNHLAEMALFRAIHGRAPALSLSLEQFERDVQPVLDDYLAGKIGEQPFLDKSRAWDNYATSYRPLIEYAKEHKLPVVAANAPEKIVRCVGREGEAFLSRLKPDERFWAAAELHTGDGPYKDKFLGFVGSDAGHGGDPAKDKAEARKTPSENALRSFAAQVTRDDTMAESIYVHLRKNPGRKVVQIIGSFHSEAFLGTVERLRLRAPELKIAVVTPSAIATSAPAHLTRKDAESGTIILLIRAAPEPYINDAEQKAAVDRQLAARAKSQCEL